MTTTVQQAVAAVMAELPGIGKGDKSPEGYTYRGIEAVTKHVQPLLAKHGVVLVPSAEITDVRPSPAMKEGWTDVFMRVSWTIVGPDGSILNAQTFGIGRDRADKGANKAMTQAFKYLLLDLLCISDAKDDSDGQTYEHDRHEQVRRPAQVLAGWSIIDEQDKAHEDFRSTVAATSNEVQAHMRDFRKDRGFAWPMPRAELDEMWDQLSSAQVALEVDGEGAPPAAAAPSPPEDVGGGALDRGGQRPSRMHARAQEVLGEDQKKRAAGEKVDA